MKITYSLITILLISVLACSKKSSTNCDAYWTQIKFKEWVKTVGCSEDFKYALGKAKYQNQVIYYNFIQCKYCKFAPPVYGFNCNNDTIPITDWSLVSDEKIIANCSAIIYPH